MIEVRQSCNSHRNASLQLAAAAGQEGGITRHTKYIGSALSAIIFLGCNPRCCSGIRTNWIVIPAPTGFEPATAGVKVLCLTAWRRGYLPPDDGDKIGNISRTAMKLEIRFVSLSLFLKWVYHFISNMSIGFEIKLFSFSNNPNAQNKYRW